MRYEDGDYKLWIRGLRRRGGLTQEELAHELGITVSTVNRWENGKASPSKLARRAIEELAKRWDYSSRAATPAGGARNASR